MAALPSDLISQFVKITKDNTPKKTESIVYGTIVKNGDTKYVKLDGADVLTPISSTTNVEDKERVTVMIKNHTAIVTGNITSPSARTAEVEDVSTDLAGVKEDVANVKILMADKIDVDELNAQKARIDELEANQADISDIRADNVTIKEKLTAAEASIDKLEADQADISDIRADNVTIKEKLTSAEADIKRIETEKLSATEAEIKYANIDFSNIGKAAFEYFYSESGLIDNVEIGDATISGNLVGVTIKGDLIEGGTVVADKLVIKGENGLYYKLNTDGVTTETEQTDYNSINGSVITAKSITATKLSVDDLVAFDATIGGFQITDNSLYSGVKSSVDNTTTGIYLDADGQFAVGDSDNYLRFYKNDDDVYVLAMSTMTIDDDGVHIHKHGYSGRNEVLVDENSVNVKMNGQIYSRFSGTYAQFGNTQIRSASDGGLIFITV